MRDEDERPRVPKVRVDLCGNDTMAGILAEAAAVLRANGRDMLALAVEHAALVTCGKCNGDCVVEPAADSPTGRALKIAESCKWHQALMRIYQQVMRNQQRAPELH